MPMLATSRSYIHLQSGKYSNHVFTICRSWTNSIVTARLIVVRHKMSFDTLIAVFCLARIPSTVRPDNKHAPHPPPTTFTKHINKFFEQGNAASTRAEYAEPEGDLMLDGNVPSYRPTGTIPSGTTPPINQHDLKHNMLLGWTITDIIQWAQNHLADSGISAD